MHITFLSTYPPRTCGIATFTQDLRAATASTEGVSRADVVAILGAEDAVQSLPPEVVYTIRQHDESDYVALAEYLNDTDTDVVSVQHEFGIFGGPEGRYLLSLLKNLRVPVATTLHTVLPEPPAHYRSALLEVAAHSDLLVVMNEHGRRLLMDVYGLDARRIAVAHHGVPTIEPGGQAEAKRALRADGRTMLLTFGLLGPSKGIEYALEALPSAVETRPDLLYVILGSTHPEIVRREGESYRNDLKARVTELGLDEHIRFDDRYADHDALCTYLSAADIYLSPYPGMDQISSGTLAYALGAGNAIVSTPYLYAQEALAEGRGCLAPSGDPEAFGRAICRLLTDESFRADTAARAFELGKAMRWPAVGEHYAELFADLHHAQRALPDMAETLPKTPRAHLAHLAALTDDTGLFQHAVHGIPDRHHGYCTDDNGRGLVAALLHHQRYGEPQAMDLARTFLAFVHYAQVPTGRFRNFMDYERRFLDAEGTEDTHGRALWGLGAVVAWSPDAHQRSLARGLFLRGVGCDLTHPRSLAYALCGGALFLERYPGCRAARQAVSHWSTRLLEQHDRTRTDAWPWFHDALTYSNAKLPHALLLAARALDCDRCRDVALESLDFLARETYDGERFDFIGNRGWYRRGEERARLDQQPIEAGYMAEACAEAYRQTGQARYATYARAAAEWFFGRNRLGRPLYDPETGACCDGLAAAGINRNQGAESVIACLLGLLAAESLAHTERGETHRPEAQHADLRAAGRATARATQTSPKHRAPSPPAAQ